MKKARNYIIVGFSFICIIFVFVTCYRNRNWTIRFKKELNKFFGDKNWECISDDQKESIMYNKNIRSHINSNPPISEEVPGEYTKWTIKFENKYGNEEIWDFSNHTFKINHDTYGGFSSKLYSSRQALILELLNLSCELASEEVLNDIIKEEFSENIVDCFRVLISYDGGNPEPKVYEKLFEQSWFNINDISVENLLKCGLCDFYIDVLVYDYKFEKLTDEEKQILFNSMEKIERKLLKTYGNEVSFKLYFDAEHKLEYIKGKKQ